MKNKYLTKCLCITLFSAMVVSSSMAVCAAEELETFVSENVVQESAPNNVETAPVVEKILTSVEKVVSEPVVDIVPTSAPEVTPAPVVTTAPSVVNETTAIPEAGNENKEQSDAGSNVPQTPVPEVSEGTQIPTVSEGEVALAPAPGGEITVPSSTPSEGGETVPSPIPGESGEVVQGPTPGEGEEVIPSPTPSEGGEVVPSPVPGEGEEVEPTPTPGEGEVVEPTPTPGEGEEVEPTPTPGEGEVVEPTPIPGEGEVVEPTPTPGEGEVVEPTPTPGEGEEVEPTPTPGEGEGIEPTPIPGEGETPGEGENTSPIPTPGTGDEITPIVPDEGKKPEHGENLPDENPEDSEIPEDGSESGDPVLPTPTPVPGEGENENTGTETPKEDEEADEVKVENLIQRLNKLLLGALTVEDEATISALRAEYDAMTDAEKELVENYHLLVSYEAKIEELKAQDKLLGSNVTTQGVVMPSTILTSAPVYYTSMVSNLHAGKEFYLDSLKSNYQITFADNFASVMAAIEREHKAKYKVTDNCDKRADGLTSSVDTLLARNWQDVIAIYCYEKSKEGYTEFYLNELCKEDLARIFEELNPIVRDKDDITRVSYANRHINYYIKEYGISKEDRDILKKYVENDCKLLCATVTGAKGFVRQSVGDAVSEERVNVITAAYSLVGKVGYFWGGKSNSVGENQNWGTAEFVSSPGSNSTGTLRAYGLDCSGFVSWAVINGYQDNSIASTIGDGTTAQWLNAQVISEAEAQPGDLVFQNGPEAGENNHVGILCGQTEAGDWIAIHCSSSKNGVTVGEAYGASFRYIRQPSVYPSDQLVAQYESMYGYTGADTSKVYVNDNLAQLLTQTGVGSGVVEFQPVYTNNSAAVFTDVADVVVFGDSSSTVSVPEGISEFVVE